MSKPCAVFWDIENIHVPKGQTVDSFVKLIRSTTIKPYNLNEVFFFCVCDLHKLLSDVEQSLTNLGVNIVQACNGIEDSTDLKVCNLMEQFAKYAGQDCAVILLSGDADYYDHLNDLKKLYNASIHLIRLGDSFPPKLDQISDYIYTWNNGILKLVKSTGSPIHFISIKNYLLNMDINCFMTSLNSQTIGSIQDSAILFRDTICIGFSTLCNAKVAFEQLNGSRFDGQTLKAELLLDSPLVEILKCIKTKVPVKTKRYDEVKQLTFIKMNNSKESVDISKTIKFCIACTTQSGSQCILSSESFIWIVFSLKSDAQEFLPKIQIIYPDAVITEPPIDLTFAENPYTIESCEQIVTNGKPANVNLEVRDKNDLKMCFRYDSNFDAPLIYYKPSKWSLLYNLFEQLYDLGAKKVIFDGNLYCAHFDSTADYQDALEKMSSRYLKPLEFVNVPETYKQEVTKKMNESTGIPWCFSELDLRGLVIKIETQLHDHFMEISKNILGHRGAIFMKSIPGEIWIGFPDELISENSKRTVRGFLENIKKADVYMNNCIFTKENLQLINFPDLAGDAYDLAFLSSQLESSKPITKPRIIELISLQRMEYHECNGKVFKIYLNGEFYDSRCGFDISNEKTVKILVNFSKVIPLAATVERNSVTLIFTTWHEAHVAHHFINKLTAAQVPYFKKFAGASTILRDVTFTNIYYIINDKRKVLDKIIQNANHVRRLNSNSSTVQSTSINDELDAESMQKLQYLFTISTNSGFEFRSAMISIIKLQLIQMNCPACIEFENKLWVGVDDLEKGNKAKANIDPIKFRILHENDEDFEVGVTMESISAIPTKVALMLANKLNSPKTLDKNTCVFLNSVAYPLGHFNYDYRRSLGMSMSRYFKLYESVSS